MDSREFTDSNDSQDSSQFSRLSSSQRRKKEDLQKRVRLCVQEGHTKEQILVSLCRERNLSKVDSIYDATQLFQHFDKSSELFEGLTHIYRTLVRIVSAEFTRRHNSIAVWPDSNVDCTAFTFLDSRYGLCIAEEESQQHLFLVDNFHGQKKKISIINDATTFTKLMNYVLELIDFNHLLVFKKNNDEDCFDIDLLRLDFIQLTGTLMSTKRIRGEYFYTFFDYKNRYNFGVYVFGHDSPDRRLILVSVDKRFRLVVKSKTIQFDDELYCGRLEGRKFSTLLPKYDDDEHANRREEFGELELVPGQNFPEFQKLFDVKMNGELDYFVTLVDHWTENVGYLIGYDDKIKLYNLIVVDLVKQELFKMRLNCYHINENAKFYVDEEQQILTLCAEDSPHEMPMIYRFTLNRPDTLNNKALFELRRRAMFYNSKLYDRFASQLPANLQPLTVCSMESAAENSSRPEEPRRKSRRIR